MNNQQRQALQIALENFAELYRKVMAAGNLGHQWTGLRLADGCSESIRAMSEALTQPQDHSKQHLNMVQGEWVDLTDDEMQDCHCLNGTAYPFALAIIAKFKEKNTPPVVPQGEPVAIAEENLMFPDGLTAHLDRFVPVGTKLYTTPPSVEAAIEATKEKAAKVCEERAKYYEMGSDLGCEAEDCAAAIRSMK